MSIPERPAPTPEPEPEADWQPVLSDTPSAEAAGAATVPPPAGHETPPAPTSVQFQPARMRQALEWLAVLGAAGIPYTLEQLADGPWRIHVPLEHGQRAASEITAFVEESKHWPPRETAAEAVPEDLGLGSLVVSLALLLAFAYTGPFEAQVPAFQQGAAEARLIVTGAWYRAVTALTLHSDFAHVMGNALCAFLLGRAACRRLGEGLGWLTILLSGILGNLATAWIYQQAHLSVGASTAVFGALGLLGSLSMRENFARGRRGWRAWGLPLLATLALLGLTGTGGADPTEPLQGFRVDVMAHLTGFLAGLALGFGAWDLRHWRARPVPQTLAWTLLASLVATAWLLAS